MTNNPFYNALTALFYIIVVVLSVSSGSQLVVSENENILMPIGMLSLFVLSVAVMAYIFFYQPVLRLLDGKRKEGIVLFCQTVGIFAGLTAVTLLISVMILK